MKTLKQRELELGVQLALLGSELLTELAKHGIEPEDREAQPSDEGFFVRRYGGEFGQTTDVEFRIGSFSKVTISTKKLWYENSEYPHAGAEVVPPSFSNERMGAYHVNREGKVNIAGAVARFVRLVEDLREANEARIENEKRSATFKVEAKEKLAGLSNPKGGKVQYHEGGEFSITGKFEGLSREQVEAILAILK